MPAEIHCPKCPSENVIFSKKRNIHVCEDCGHEFMVEKPFAKMRIFLSYGHDGNEELVRCIKADLAKRGHDVWFDKNEIKFGDEWRRSITDGILKSNRVLSFLSKHSTRDPGVCRDEIAIAIGVKGGNIQTILVESEQEVQPPVNIGHIQWLDMHDWKERRAAGEAAWEQWYQAKLAEIVRVVESEESLRFAGEIGVLNGHLKPIKSDARICQLLSKGFYGRQWLFEAVEKWRQDTKLDSRLFWIMGAPGVGKSAFAAQLTHTRGDTVIAAQFCEWDKPDHRNAQRVVRSLAFQLATRLPDYRKLLLTLPEIAELDRKDVVELFDYLLANPLCSVINGGRERYLIVIDALDESGEAGRNPLVEMLARNAQRLPNWLGLVVTSRPEFDVKTPLQAFNPFPLDTQSESNRADIRDYLRRELATPLQNRQDADRLVEQILGRSEGVFLYVERFCDDVQRGHLSLDLPEQFPRGLGGIFCQYFQRQFPDLEKFRKDVRPALRAILAAREPLPVEILQRLFNWQDEELHDFTRTLGSLFPVTKEVHGDVIKPYHKSLKDWLANEQKADIFYISEKDGHQILADWGMQEFKNGVGKMSHYTNEHLPMHLAESERWEELTTLINQDDLMLLDRWTSKGHYQEGLICLTGIIEYLRQQNKNLELEAGLITQLARIYSPMGKYIEAEKRLQRVLKLSPHLDNRRIVAIAHHELGSLYLYKGDKHNAAVEYSEALRLCIQCEPKYNDEAAANLLGLATIRLLQYRYDEVFRLAGDALQKARNAADTPHTIAANKILANAYKDNLEYDKAAQHLQIATLLSELENLPKERISIYHLRGWICYTQAILNNEDITPAIGIFENMLKEAEKYQLRPYIIAAKIGLIWCILAQNVPVKANSLLCQIEKELLSACTHDLEIGIQLCHAAITHQRGYFDLAQLQYQTAINLSQKYEHKSREADAWQGLGATYWHMNLHNDAESCWEKAKALSRKCSPVRHKLILLGIERSRTNQASTPL